MSIKMSATPSMGNVKRKSGDVDSSENTHPNINVDATLKSPVGKKQRAVDKSSATGPATVSKGTSKLPTGRSGIAQPKYRATAAKSTTADKTPSKLSQPMTKGSSVKRNNTAPEPQPKLAPTLVQLLQSLQTRCGTSLRQSFLEQFDPVFPQEKDSSATAPVTSKSKAKAPDFRELKEIVKSNELIIKSMKEKFMTGTSAKERFLPSLSEVDELLTRSYAELQSKEALLIKKDQMHAELLEAVKSLEQALTDIEALRKEKSHLTCQIAQLSGELSESKAIVDNAMQGMEASESEIRELKESFAKSRAELVEKHQQELELMRTSHTQECGLLRTELDKYRDETNVAKQFKSESDSKTAELREQLSCAQSALKDVEGALRRSEQEATRLTTEVSQLKEQLTQKDGDLRSTLSSMQEAQRLCADEKALLRADAGGMQQRLMSLEQERLSTTAELATRREESSANTREIAALREALATAESRLAARDQELAEARQAGMQLEVEREVRSKCEIREEAERRERVAACAQLLATQMECESRMREFEQKAAAQAEALRADTAAEQVKTEAAKAEARTNAEQVLRLQSELEQLRSVHQEVSTHHSAEAVEELGRVKGELEILRKRLRESHEQKSAEESAANQRIKSLEDMLKTGEIQRRKLHNVIQELRGNVRVFARVRPFLPNDGLDLAALPEPTIQVRPDDTSLRISKAALGDHRSEDHPFSFDKVFGPSSSQESVFAEVSEFIQSALDGYHVCLFSYGQTGSGKTHTMQGSGNGSMRGIIPRAIEQVGKYKTDLESNGWKYSMEVSFVEIYNETIRDLLRTRACGELKHEIKREGSVTTITDVELIPVDPNDKEQLEEIMELAARHRSVAKTDMNEQSSRSHSVFTLHLRATHAAQNIHLRGTLNLVDLAGSERLDRSGATGATAKETVAINKSLSALSDVFVAIGNKQPHIPFRNSKLTYLLQPALSGDGKTLMMVNLSPTEASYFESLCSLRFAAQVNQCELGKPKRQLRDSAAAGGSSSVATPQSATATPNHVARTGQTLATSASAGGARKLMRK